MTGIDVETIQLAAENVVDRYGPLIQLITAGAALVTVFTFAVKQVD